MSIEHRTNPSLAKHSETLNNNPKAKLSRRGFLGGAMASVPVLAGASVLLSSSANGATATSQFEVDTVYRGCELLADGTSVNAFIRGETVVGIDTSYGASNGNAQNRDARGYLLSPGYRLVSSNVAFTASQFARFVDWSDCQTLGEGLSKLRDASKVEDMVIVRGGWSPETFIEGRGPNREDLDNVCGGIPCIVMAEPEFGAMNTAAIELLELEGVAYQPRQGRFLRDQYGNFTGQFVGDGATVIFRDVMQRIPATSGEFRAKGIATFAATLKAEQVRTLVETAANTTLPADVVAALGQAGVKLAVEQSADVRADAGVTLRASVRQAMRAGRVLRAALRDRAEVDWTGFALTPVDFA